VVHQVVVRQDRDDCLDQVGNLHRDDHQEQTQVPFVAPAGAEWVDQKAT
jgi:hypothetical protein